MGGHNPVADLIADKGWCVADGATGSNFFGRGLEAGYPPELWCLEKPEEVAALHDAFLDAGADLILTNSFGGNALRLKLHASEHRVAELNIAAAQLASEATQRHFAATGRKTLVAGSIGPTGELFVPMGMLDHRQAVEVFREQATGPSRRAVQTYSGSKRCRRQRRSPPRPRRRRPPGYRFAPHCLSIRRGAR